MVFRDRVHAGRELAEALQQYKGEDVIVYGLPRGGVVLASEVARFLDNAPLDLMVARKIGHPDYPEYAIGAVTETGRPVWNTTDLGFTGQQWRDDQVRAARAEAMRRRKRYMDDRQVISSQDRIAILVDDGVATGLTMRAALYDLRLHHPSAIVAAAPVAPWDVATEIALEADDIAILETPRRFLGSVGAYYSEFRQVSDEEVRQLLDAYHGLPSAGPLDLAGLNSVLATVDDYPVTGRQLAEQARRLKAPKNVINFFETHPSDTRYQDKADVLRRSEAAEVLMEQAAAEPDEQLHSYD